MPPPSKASELRSTISPDLAKGRRGERPCAMPSLPLAPMNMSSESFWSELAQIPGVRLWGVPFTHAMRAPTVSFTMAGLDCAALARKLGAAGICVWDGDFYAPRPVQVLNAPGGSLLRVGFSMYNTRAEATRLLAMVRDLS